MSHMKISLRIHCQELALAVHESTQIVFKSLRRRFCTKRLDPRFGRKLFSWRYVSFWNRRYVGLLVHEVTIVIRWGKVIVVIYHNAATL